jgi:hypothetical protein
MGFGQCDGTLDKAEKRVGQFAGCPGLFPGALSRAGLKVLRKVVRDRLEHALNGLLHPRVRISKLQCKGTEKAKELEPWREISLSFYAKEHTLVMNRVSLTISNPTFHSQVRQRTSRLIAKVLIRAKPPF